MRKEVVDSEVLISCLPGLCGARIVWEKFENIWSVAGKALVKKKR